MNKFQRWHDQLWQLRKEIGHDRYPIPSPEDALAFAVTEATEALDAWLMQKGTWVRNNPDAKHTDEYREWAQCAMMLMLALGEGYEYDEMDFAPLTRAGIVAMIACAYDEVVDGLSGVDDWGEELVLLIDIYCVGLDSHIEAEMQRLRDKWLPEGGE